MSSGGVPCACGKWKTPTVNIAVIGSRPDEILVTLICPECGNEHVRAASTRQPMRVQQGGRA